MNDDPALAMPPIPEAFCPVCDKPVIGRMPVCRVCWAHVSKRVRIQFWNAYQGPMEGHALGLVVASVKTIRKSA